MSAAWWSVVWTRCWSPCPLQMASGSFTVLRCASRGHRDWGAIRTIGTACAVRIVDRVGRKQRPIPALGVAGGIRIVRIRAQLAAVISLLVVEPWRIGREGIPRRLIAEWTAIRTEWIVDPVRCKGTPRSLWIGHRILVVRIRTQFPKVFGGDSNRTEKGQEEK